MMKPKTILIVLAVFLIMTFVLPLDTLGKGKQNGPPPWAPAHGYRAKTRQIYFPEYNFYYDTQKSVYIYFSSNQWQIEVKLPSLYVGVDLKGAVKMELELDTDSPQKYNADHKVKYKGKTKTKGNKGKAKKKQL